MFPFSSLASRGRRGEGRKRRWVWRGKNRETGGKIWKESERLGGIIIVVFIGERMTLED